MPPSSRARQSAPPPSRASLAPPATAGGTGQTTTTRVELPEPLAPVAPLDADAQTRLNELLRGRALAGLSDSLTNSARLLIDAAGDIGDRLRERRRHVEGRKRKHDRMADGGASGGDNVENEQGGEAEQRLRDEEESVRELDDKVERMTRRMEVALRRTIDGHSGINNLRQTIHELSSASAAALRDTAEHRTQLSQRQSQRSAVARAATAAAVREDDDAMSDGDVTQIPPQTAQSNADGGGMAADEDSDPPPPQIPALAPAFADALQRLNDAYTARPLAARYADHPDYTNFKRVTHDARHGDDGRALPHKRHWFANEEGRAAPAPGETSSGAQQHRRRTTGPSDGDDHHPDAEVIGSEDDDDSDIAIASVRISTRCPLTLRELEDPVTSATCGHSYERTAIVPVIRQQQRPPTGRNTRNPPQQAAWVPEVQCPVAGCAARVSEASLATDALLVRKIRRIQRARAHAGAFGDDDDEDEYSSSRRRRTRTAEVESVDSASESGDDVDRLVDEHEGGAARIKSEAAQQQQQRRRASTRQRTDDEGASEVEDNEVEAV